MPPLWRGLLLYLVIPPTQKGGSSLPNNLVLMKQVFSKFNLPFLNAYLVLYVLKHECWLHGVHNTDFEFSKFANFDWFINLNGC